MNKNYIIMILSVFALVLGLQVWAQNTDVLNPQDQTEAVQVMQTQEDTNPVSESNQQQEVPVQDVIIQNVSIQEESVVTESTTPSVASGSDQEVSTGATVNTGAEIEPVVGTSVAATQPIVENNIIEQSNTSHVVFANPRTGTEVINGQFVKKTEIADLSPQAQDFVATILK